ncbi:dihydrodipicolinate synthase family protein [Arthrobacter monumenti]
MDFTGVIAYPVTPFTASGEVNLNELRRMISSLAASSVDAIAVLGSSGSFAYLDRAERSAVVGAAVEEAAAVNPKLPVYAGVSAVSTREILASAADAEDAGVAGLVVSAVSYVPLTIEEVATQSRTLAERTDLPICLYNNPSTTQFDFPVELVAELATVANIVALKDPGTSREAYDERLAALREVTPREFSLGMSGDTSIVDNAVAADAWHSGPAALLPEHYVRLRRALIADDAAEFSSCREVLTPVIHALAAQRKLSSLHSLARACGWDAGDPRLPLLPVPGSQQRELARLIDLLD